MPDHDLPAVPPFNVDVALERIAGLPAHLPGDQRRQAVSSIRGTVYQAWWSIDAWLQLKNADDVIYLEEAEDFDIVKPDTAITVQVKHTADSLSLGTAKAYEALENFWTLCCKAPSRRIDFHYLTTSTIAMEHGANFNGLKGIEAWRAAQTSPELAVKITEFLKEKLPTTSPLRAFLTNSSPEIIQHRLIDRFHWLTEQPDIAAVKRSVDDRICVLLGDFRRSISLSSSVQNYLESYFWKVISKSLPAERCLTRGELLRQVTAATTVNLSIPIDQFPDILGNTQSGFALLNHLLQKSPSLPRPLLKRPALTQHLEEIVKQRRIVLLTGSVYKGKTTLAQLVASAMCPNAWWITLTGRQQDQVDTLFRFLARKIESGDSPGLLIIDDLDVSPTAHRIYRNSLEILLHRATASGNGVILTAQGVSNVSSIVEDFGNIELLDMPEMSDEETASLCFEHGCPESLSKIWGSVVKGTTLGHPKLVQVRIADLASRGWPTPSPNDLFTQSSAVITVRQKARELFRDSVPDSVAEFVYLVSECSLLMHRSIAIRLAESVDGLTNAGDILDSLTGKWLECIESDWFRATALLQGVASEVWSPEKRKMGHIRLHDAIRAKSTLDPSEAAALLYHAFFGQDRARLTHTAIRLQTIENRDVRHKVEGYLFWLPLVALEPGQTFTDNVTAEVILRQLQFRVATTLDSDTLLQICDRWVEAIEQISSPQAKPTMQSVMWPAFGYSQNLKVPLKHRLKAIAGVETLPQDLQDFQAELNLNLLGGTDVAEAGIPNTATIPQMMFLFSNQSIRSSASLEELLQWLDNEATENIRQQFDVMLEWPVTQAVGAFVQGAWAAKHEETQDWEPWLRLLGKVDDYSKRNNSPRFGREAAKAKAILLTEYLDRSTDAISVLDHANVAFGSSAVLLEQRANVLFHKQDDEKVLEIWAQLTSSQASTSLLDAFAYRRAGISAARLKRWAEAEQIFLAAAAPLTPGPLELTKFGLQVDATLIAFLRGDHATASRILVEAVLALPAEAAAEGDLRRDAVQRIAFEVCTTIEKSYWKRESFELRVKVGDASSPNLRAPKAEAGQTARNELIRAQVVHLAATLGVGPPSIADEIETLSCSKYVYVRWLASQARLALSYASGSGTGFVRALIAFETELVDLSTKQDRLIEPDAGPALNLTISPERWVGLLAAGIVCSGSDLLSNLAIWLNESSQELGTDTPLTNAIRLINDGASRPAEILWETVQDTENSGMVRCGTAARLLLDMPVASKTLELQAFLTSAAVSDLSFARQDLFNLHVARRFAGAWRAQSENRFQFSSPRTSVPALLRTVHDVEAGTGTLKSLLQAASNALGQSLGSFMKHVF